MIPQKMLPVRRVELSDWLEVSLIEDRWRSQGVEPLSRQVFETWIQTNQNGFVAAIDAKGSICGHAYGELINFSPHDLHDREKLKIFSRPYYQPHHNPHGNSLLALNVVAIPGSFGGQAALSALTTDAMVSGKEWVIYLPRMPGLATYIESVSEFVKERNLDMKSVITFYAVTSMRLVGADVNSVLSKLVEDLKLPLPNEPDQVLARFVGARLHASLVDLVTTGYEDPKSMNYAGLCIRKLN